MNGESRAAMKRVLEEVRSGEFARAWIAESDAGGAGFRQRREQEGAHAIEEVGQRLRQRMAWLQETP